MRYKQFFIDSGYGFLEANYPDYGSQAESAANPISPGQTFTASGTNFLATYNGVVGIGYTLLHDLPVYGPE